MNNNYSDFTKARDYISPTLLNKTTANDTTGIWIGKVFHNLYEKCAVTAHQVYTLITEFRWINENTIKNNLSLRIKELSEIVQTEDGKEPENFDSWVQALREACNILKDRRSDAVIENAEGELERLEEKAKKFHEKTIQSTAIKIESIVEEHKDEMAAGQMTNQVEVAKQVTLQAQPSRDEDEISKNNKNQEASQEEVADDTTGSQESPQDEFVDDQTNNSDQNAFNFLLDLPDENVPASQITNQAVKDEMPESGQESGKDPALSGEEQSHPQPEEQSIINSQVSEVSDSEKIVKKKKKCHDVLLLDKNTSSSPWIMPVAVALAGIAIQVIVNAFRPSPQPSTSIGVTVKNGLGFLDVTGSPEHVNNYLQASSALKGKVTLYEKTITGLENNVNGLNQEKNGLEKAVNDLKREKTYTDSELRSTNKKFENTKEELSKVREELGKAKKIIAELKDKVSIHARDASGLQHPLLTEAVRKLMLLNQHQTIIDFMNEIIDIALDSPQGIKALPPHIMSEFFEKGLSKDSPKNEQLDYIRLYLKLTAEPHHRSPIYNATQPILYSPESNKPVLRLQDTFALENIHEENLEFLKYLFNTHSPDQMGPFIETHLNKSLGAKHDQFLTNVIIDKFIKEGKYDYALRRLEAIYHQPLATESVKILTDELLHAQLQNLPSENQILKTVYQSVDYLFKNDKSKEGFSLLIDGLNEKKPTELDKNTIISVLSKATLQDDAILKVNEFLALMEKKFNLQTQSEMTNILLKNIPAYTPFDRAISYLNSLFNYGPAQWEKNKYLVTRTKDHHIANNSIIKNIIENAPLPANSNFESFKEFGAFLKNIKIQSQIWDQFRTQFFNKIVTSELSDLEKIDMLDNAIKYNLSIVDQTELTNFVLNFLTTSENLEDKHFEKLIGLIKGLPENQKISDLLLEHTFKSDKSASEKLEQFNKLASLISNPQELISSYSTCKLNSEDIGSRALSVFLMNADRIATTYIEDPTLKESFKNQIHSVTLSHIAGVSKDSSGKLSLKALFSNFNKFFSANYGLFEFDKNEVYHLVKSGKILEKDVSAEYINFAAYCREFKVSRHFVNSLTNLIFDKINAEMGVIPTKPAPSLDLFNQQKPLIESFTDLLNSDIDLSDSHSKLQPISKKIVQNAKVFSPKNSIYEELNKVQSGLLKAGSYKEFLSFGEEYLSIKGYTKDNYRSMDAITNQLEELAKQLSNDPEILTKAEAEQTLNFVATILNNHKLKISDLETLLRLATPITEAYPDLKIEIGNNLMQRYVVNGQLHQTKALSELIMAIGKPENQSYFANALLDNEPASFVQNFIDNVYEILPESLAADFKSYADQTWYPIKAVRSQTTFLELGQQALNQFRFTPLNDLAMKFAQKYLITEGPKHANIQEQYDEMHQALSEMAVILTHEKKKLAYDMLSKVNLANPIFAPRVEQMSQDLNPGFLKSFGQTKFPEIMRVLINKLETSPTEPSNNPLIDLINEEVIKGFDSWVNNYQNYGGRLSSYLGIGDSVDYSHAYEDYLAACALSAEAKKPLPAVDIKYDLLNLKGLQSLIKIQKRQVLSFSTKQLAESIKKLKLEPNEYLPTLKLINDNHLQLLNNDKIYCLNFIFEQFVRDESISVSRKPKFYLEMKKLGILPNFKTQNPTATGPLRSALGLDLSKLLPKPEQTIEILILVKNDFLLSDDQKLKIQNNLIINLLENRKLSTSDQLNYINELTKKNLWPSTISDSLESKLEEHYANFQPNPKELFQTLRLTKKQTTANSILNQFIANEALDVVSQMEYFAEMVKEDLFPDLATKKINVLLEPFKEFISYADLDTRKASATKRTEALKVLLREQQNLGIQAKKRAESEIQENIKVQQLQTSTWKALNEALLQSKIPENKRNKLLSLLIFTAENVNAYPNLDVTIAEIQENPELFIQPIEKFIQTLHLLNEINVKSNLPIFLVDIPTHLFDTLISNKTISRSVKLNYQLEMLKKNIFVKATEHTLKIIEPYTTLSYLTLQNKTQIFNKEIQTRKINVKIYLAEKERLILNEESTLEIEKKIKDTESDIKTLEVTYKKYKDFLTDWNASEGFLKEITKKIIENKSISDPDRLDFLLGTFKVRLDSQEAINQIKQIFDPYLHLNYKDEQEKLIAGWKEIRKLSKSTLTRFEKTYLMDRNLSEKDLLQQLELEQRELKIKLTQESDPTKKALFEKNLKEIDNKTKQINEIVQRQQNQKKMESKINDWNTCKHLLLKAIHSTPALLQDPHVYDIAFKAATESQSITPSTRLGYFLEILKASPKPQEVIEQIARIFEPFKKLSEQKLAMRKLINETLPQLEEDYNQLPGEINKAVNPTEKAALEENLKSKQIEINQINAEISNAKEIASKDKAKLAVLEKCNKVLLNANETMPILHESTILKPLIDAANALTPANKTEGRQAETA